MNGDAELSETESSAGASFIPYGPPASDVRIVETFGEYEAEYAAIRKGVGILQTPQRGLIRLRGADRLSFINQLITNEAGALPIGGGCRAMILNRHGRIQGDLLILNAEEELLVITDVFQAAAIGALMEQYVFTEDVEVEQSTENVLQLSLHGPSGLELLTEVVGKGQSDAVAGHEPIAHFTVEVSGVPCRVYRMDETGSPGWHLVVPRVSGLAIFKVLTDTVGGLVPEVSGGHRRRFGGRGIGWLAYNTARIEAGTPVFHVDYGLDSLPHETGLLRDTVSFTKGCYPGQEIVARMENLGHPKQVLVGLRGEDERLPLAGSSVYQGTAESSSDVVGAVTSSTVSPLCGNTAIAFAMVRWDLREPGAIVHVHDATGSILCTVHPCCFMQ